MPEPNSQTGFAAGKGSADNETPTRVRRQKSVRWPPTDGQPAPLETCSLKAIGTDLFIELPRKQNMRRSAPWIDRLLVEWQSCD